MKHEHYGKFSWWKSESDDERIGAVSEVKVEIQEESKKEALLL